jgi:hypothetical protein
MLHFTDFNTTVTGLLISSLFNIVEVKLCVQVQSITAGHEYRLILLHKLRLINRKKYYNCISIVKPTRCTNVSNLFYFILFWSNTLHVSEGFSVHHQEFKTVHTATGICQTDTADCMLASNSSICLTYACCCMYSLELLMMDGKPFRNMQIITPK